MNSIKRKIQRHIDIYFFPSKVNKQLEQRKGDCLRCGKCCRLVFKCPALKETPDGISCSIYTHRSKVCSLFPVCRDDIADVGWSCGYTFETTIK